MDNMGDRFHSQNQENQRTRRPTGPEGPKVPRREGRHNTAASRLAPPARLRSCSAGAALDPNRVDRSDGLESISLGLVKGTDQTTLPIHPQPGPTPADGIGPGTLAGAWSISTQYCGKLASTGLKPCFCANGRGRVYPFRSEYCRPYIMDGP